MARKVIRIDIDNRNALREQINKVKMKEAILEISHLKGLSNKKISRKEYEKARKNAFEELGKFS